MIVLEGGVAADAVHEELGGEGREGLAVEADGLAVLIGVLVREGKKNEKEGGEMRRGGEVNEAGRRRRRGEVLRLSRQEGRGEGYNSTGRICHVRGWSW